MNRKELFDQIQAKKSMLCVGLDVDFDKMPEHIKALALDGAADYKGELFKGKARSILEFNKAIVDATAAHCVAYKPNLAFYECYGIEPVPSRGGGSIPILADLQRILGIDPLLMGFGLERDTIHSPNESYLLKQLFAGMEAIALFYRYY